MLLMEPLLETVRSILRTDLDGVTDPTNSIRITQTEKVPQYAGEEFINIFAPKVEIASDEFSGYREESYSFSVGITRRLIGIPTDHAAEAIYIEDLVVRTKSSMAMRAYEIIDLIDGSWGIPATIRQMDSLSSYDFCIMSVLAAVEVTDLEEVFGEHFRNEQDDNDNPSGLFLEIKFSGLQTYYNRY